MASKAEDDLQNFRPFNAPANEDKLKCIAQIKLGEMEEVKAECLQQLRKFIKDHKVPCITRDDFLLRFLRIKKFDVQRSFTALQNYACRRAELHDRLLRLKPETLRAVFSHNILGILPFRDTEERLIFFFRAGIWNPSICSYEEFFTIICMFCNYAAEPQSSQITGVALIFEARPIPLAEMLYILSIAGFMKNFLFDSLPARYHKLHCLNDILMLKTALRLLSPFIPKKLRDRVLFHGSNRELLFQHISPTILPEDFGGSLGPLSSDHMVEVMVDYLKNMKDEQHFFFPETNLHI